MRNKSQNYSFLFNLLLISFCADFASAQTKTTVYTYDALGRLTFVNDSVNGNRDYDYDRAGNRTEVAVGTASDNEFGDPLPAPTLTGAGCAQVAPGAYRGRWNAVAGAAAYLYRTQVGNEYLVLGLESNVYTSSCDWVRACSTTNQASCIGIKADF